MAYLKTSLLKLETNPKEVFDEATRLLIKIADNILKEPENIKIRTLQKANLTISKKILQISGGLECLKMMGFEESDIALVLPPNASLKGLQSIRNEISKRRDETMEKDKEEPNAFAALLQSSIETELRTSTASSSSSDAESISSDDNSDSAPTQGAIPKVLNKPVEPKSDSPKKKGQIMIPDDVPTVKLPPLEYMFINPFLRRVEMAFHMALSYGDKALQERAKSFIPIRQLEIAAQERLRHLQEQVKKGNSEDPNISLQDMLILELLSWFKNDFFNWVDSPECNHCGGITNFSHMSDDPALMVHTERVEMHKCNDCQQLTPFPRYNDVNILLITRAGRCGEWANTFTLMCCAMGWDARHVIDEGDHVWTEVYSFAQKRWLHCDPCENVCDTPLMYENGWGKQLTYVMAYSAEEVQDVTWRYSSYHKDVRTRRKQCAEKELLNAMFMLREQRQKNLSPARKDFLVKRLLSEITELMVEKKPGTQDQQGRTSGSLAWRTQRGEFREVIKSYCWILAKQHTDVGNITIRYSTALDQYEYITSDGNVNTVLKEWHAGTFTAKSMFRKVEKDWKKVYLARAEGTDSGSITWKFTTEDPKKVFSTLDIKFDHELFENGNAHIHIQADMATINFPIGASQFRTELGCRHVTITATLSGGKGDVAWQHAQLFRQSTDSKEYPFSVTFSFQSIS